ncbi:hypothetical protein ISF_04844 [Cordyceps fumosorosea ARSEF 2679]|uniref:Peroxin 20 n=1 Tax=Cordyceps fumosorosea (strain ARSEF 2679) TaxID=1081104 RepID=A0A167VTK4_CORFA|nr:hypothetical protein ISF_04844 [Cordyceps fumosorosea ARSEF 2679]OAA62968.1 hypothetical protein ISF_04844 [Cordyceps fumosorosea ARSEF 2679]
MAEASCSGGTPFKQLIDHQSRDVSHHQDRLVNGSQPLGAFRSQSQNMAQGPQEFDAFMGTPAGLPGMPHDPAGRLAAHAAALNPAQASASAFRPSVAPELTYHASHAAAPGMSSNWAADFASFAAQQPQRQQPQQRPGGPAFAGAANPMQMGGFHGAFAPSHAGSFSPFFAPAGGAYAQQPVAAAGEADFDQEMAKWMASNAAASGNMAQVDAAMEQMARELELNDQALADADAATAATQDEGHFSDLGVPEINNLSLDSREAPTVTPPEPLEEENTVADMLADDARSKSAVSEAAERLLESVQHESGEKWQNSVFLALMRDFRDGKKDIIGNEVQPTEGAGPSGEASSSAADAAVSESVAEEASAPPAT